MIDDWCRICNLIYHCLSWNSHLPWIPAPTSKTTRSTNFNAICKMKTKNIMHIVSTSWAKPTGWNTMLKALRKIIIKTFDLLCTDIQRLLQLVVCTLWMINFEESNTIYIYLLVPGVFSERKGDAAAIVECSSIR